MTFLESTATVALSFSACVGALYAVERISANRARKAASKARQDREDAGIAGVIQSSWKPHRSPDGRYATTRFRPQIKL